MDTILDSHHAEAGTPEYAGFWQRFVAMIIDSIVLVIVQSIIMFAFMGSFLMTGDNAAVAGLTNRVYTAWILIMIAQWLYYALMESSSNQGTLGKMALNIKVTNLQGNRISFGQATGRYFSKIISAVIVLIGYLMMLWSDKKQCLHDMMAATLVVKK